MEVWSAQAPKLLLLVSSPVSFRFAELLWQCCEIELLYWFRRHDWCCMLSKGTRRWISRTRTPCYDAAAWTSLSESLKMGAGTPWEQDTYLSCTYCCSQAFIRQDSFIFYRFPSVVLLIRSWLFEYRACAVLSHQSKQSPMIEASFRGKHHRHYWRFESSNKIK
jgi:hypothetical protein